MACKPKLPTGEKKPPKFQAPIFVPAGNSADLQRMLASAFSNIAADLEGLHNVTDTPPLTTPVTAVAGVVMAKAGDVLRLMPGPAGIQVLLPTARSTNKGQDVSIIVQGATGNVTVRAVEGKVQGVASVTLTGDGLRVFRSDGGDGTATGAGAWWIVGRNSADSTAAFVGIVAGTRTISSGFASFADDQNVFWGASGNTITANASVRFFGLPGAVDGAALSFVNVPGFSMSLSSFTFANGGKTKTGGQYTPTLGAFLTTESQLGLISHVGGNAVSSATRLAFSNASGVTFSLSTAAGAATLLGSVNDQSIGLVSHIGGNVVSSVTRLAFSNASNVTWSLSTAAGAATVIASVAAGGGGGETKTVLLATYPSALSSSLSNATDTAFSGNPLVFQSLGTDLSAYSRANVFWRLSGGSMVGVAPQLYMASTQIISANVLSFQDGSGITWNLGSSANDPNFGRIVRVQGSVSQSAQTFIGGIAGGTQTATSGTIVFSNSNNVSFALAGSTRMTASFALRASAGASSADLSNLVFTNTNNVGFAISTDAAGGTIRAAASINFSAGVASGNLSNLVFSNSNGVAFGLNGSTITASVAAAAAGGIAIAASGSTQSDSTVNFARATVLDGGMASASINNVAFAFGGGASSTQILATALMRVTANLTTSGGFPVSKINFVDGGGIQFGVATSNDAEGRAVNVTAKQPDINLYMNNGVGSGYIVIVTSASLWLTPFLYPMPGNITANTFEMLVAPAGANSSSYAYTLRGGLYILTNSTQLTLVNSFSTTASSTTQNSTDWNNRIAGDRYITVNSSLWSSSPAFSAGVQYWLGLVQATGGGVALIPSWYANRFFQIGGTGFKGDVGVSHANSSQYGHQPFFGFVNTTGIPASIGTVGVTDAGPSFSAGLPVFNLRQGIFRGP